MAPKKGKGNKVAEYRKKKRDKLNSKNPRGNKKGGGKPKVRGKSKMLAIPKDAKEYLWKLHIKYHHNRKWKKSQVCKNKKCPLKGKLI